MCTLNRLKNYCQIWTMMENILKQILFILKIIRKILKKCIVQELILLQIRNSS